MMIPLHSMSAFRQWWLSELLAALPESLVRLWQPRRALNVLIFMPQGVVLSHDEKLWGEPDKVKCPDVKQAQPLDRVLHTLSGQDWSSQRVMACLGNHQTLQKIIELPLAAEENLREVLSFEMDKYTPFREDQVCFDYALMARLPKREKIRIHLSVVPKRIIDPIIARLQQENIPLHAIRVAPYQKLKASARINLLPDRLVPEEKGQGKRELQWLSVITGVLFLIAISLPVLQSYRHWQFTQQAMASVSEESRQAVNLRDKIDARLDKFQFLLDKKEDKFTTLKVLSELTQRLPEGAWLSFFSQQDQKISLQGETVSTAGLVSFLDESPLFENVMFQSAITRNQKTGFERFHITATLSKNGQ
jgi:general secretion pathway protein L